MTTHARKILKTPDLDNYISNHLTYRKDLGGFIWKEHPTRKSLNGKRAGYTNNIGYRVIRGKQIGNILEHRLVWYYFNGYVPDKLIDHVDTVRDNNDIDNLRLCDKKQNGQNRGCNKNNKSGLKGIYFNKNRNKWYASIRVNGKDKHLGVFFTKEEAHQAYIEASKKYFKDFHFSPSHDGRW